MFLHLVWGVLVFCRACDVQVYQCIENKVILSFCRDPEKINFYLNVLILFKYDFSIPSLFSTYSKKRENFDGSTKEQSLILCYFENGVLLSLWMSLCLVSVHILSLVFLSTEVLIKKSLQIQLLPVSRVVEFRIIAQNPKNVWFRKWSIGTFCIVSWSIAYALHIMQLINNSKYSFSCISNVILILYGA